MTARCLASFYLADKELHAPMAAVRKAQWNVAPFGLRGASSLLMCVMNQAPIVRLDFQAGPAQRHLHSAGP